MAKPTAKQKRIWNKMAEFGCLPCYLDGNPGTPATISHAHDHGYRDHDKIFPCCPVHHLEQHAVNGIPNRHKNPKEFAAQYGTDDELVRVAYRLIGEKQ